MGEFIDWCGEARRGHPGTTRAMRQFVAPLARGRTPPDQHGRVSRLPHGRGRARPAAGQQEQADPISDRPKSPQHRMAAGEVERRRPTTGSWTRRWDFCLPRPHPSPRNCQVWIPTRSFEAWQALTEPRALLDPTRPGPFVRSLRRRSHHATTPRSGQGGATVGSVLQRGYGPRVLRRPGNGHRLRPGARWPPDELPGRLDRSRRVARRSRARASNGRGTTNGPRTWPLVRASFGGLAVGIHRGWRPPLGRGRGDGTSTGANDGPADRPFPVVAPRLEAHLAMIGPDTLRKFSAWLLDLRTIAAAKPRDLEPTAVGRRRRRSEHHLWRRLGRKLPSTQRRATRAATAPDRRGRNSRSGSTHEINRLAVAWFP